MRIQRGPGVPGSHHPWRGILGVLTLLAVAAVLVLMALPDGRESAQEVQSPASRPSEARPTLETVGVLSGEPSLLDARPEEQSEGHVVVVGRVVGEDYTPREHATVRVRSSDRSERTTETAADGRFELDFGPPPTSRVHASLVALYPAYLVGSVSFHVDPPGPFLIDVGTIALAQGLDLPVRVVHDEKPVAGARVFAASIRIADATRADAWLGRPWSGWSHEAVSDARGLAVLKSVPAGAVRLVATADGPLRGEIQVRTDLLEPPIVVELTQARHLRVEVVRAVDGSGVPGCPVAAQGARRLLEEPWTRPVTDANGVAVLRHAPNEPFELLIAGPDWCSAYLKMARKVPAEVTTFRTEVPEPTRISVPIEVADGPMPTDGTRVAIESDSWAWWPGTRTHLAREAVVHEGALVIETYYNLSSIRALARLPDGRAGHLWLQRPKHGTDDRGVLPPVVFHHPRSVDVHITERGTGKPAVSVAVTLSVPRSGGHVIGPVRTDTEGRARLEGAAAMKGFLDLCLNPDWVAPHRQGVFAPAAEVDLTKGDVSVELQVEPMVDAVLRVRTENGPHLPPGLDVLLFYSSQGVGGVRPGGLRLDPARGELTFRARRPIEVPQPPLKLTYRPQRIQLRITSATHATEVVTLEYDEAAGQLAGQADLVPACSLITRLRKPDVGRFSFQLQRQDEGGGWVREPTPRLVRFAGEPDEDRYEGLRPGRYRVIETIGKKTSDEVQVRASDEPTLLTWDLAPVLYAEGTVVLPTGVELKGLQVYAVTEGERPEYIGRATMEGTDFKIRVTLGQLIRLVPVHPKCKPADEEGYVVIAGPDNGLRLRMVAR